MSSHSRGHLPSHTPGSSFLQVNALESYGQRGALLRGQGECQTETELKQKHIKTAAVMASPFFFFLLSPSFPLFHPPSPSLQRRRRTLPRAMWGRATLNHMIFTGLRTGLFTYLSQVRQVLLVGFTSGSARVVRVWNVSPKPMFRATPQSSPSVVKGKWECAATKTWVQFCMPADHNE